MLLKVTSSVLQVTFEVSWYLPSGIIANKNTDVPSNPCIGHYDLCSLCFSLIPGSLVMPFFFSSVSFSAASPRVLTEMRLDWDFWEVSWSIREAR